MGNKPHQSTAKICTLHVLFAREAHLGVIFRYTLGKKTLQILWDTKRNTFAEGQWLRAVIRPEWCDVSPNGKYLAYFASNGHSLGAKRLKGFEDSWTAICRPPYFSALAVFPESGVYYGGGTFSDNNTFLLNGYASYSGRTDTTWLDKPPKHHPDYPPTGITVRYIPSVFPDYPEAQSTDQLLKLKNGWECLKAWSYGDWTRIYTKHSPNQNERLIERYNYWAFPTYHYELEKRGKITPLEHVDWADYDQRGRLVYAKGGTLWARLENGDHRQLADFTDRIYRKLPPPDDALKW